MIKQNMGQLGQLQTVRDSSLRCSLLFVERGSDPHILCEQKLNLTQEEEAKRFKVLTSASLARILSLHTASLKSRAFRVLAPIMCFFGSYSYRNYVFTRLWKLKLSGSRLRRIRCVFRCRLLLT